MLSVVDDDDERLDQQSLQLALEPIDREPDVHALGRDAELVAEHIGRARHSRPDRVEEMDQQPPALAVIMRAGEPRDVAGHEADRVRERRGLAVSRGRYDEQRPAEERVSDPRGEPLARNRVRGPARPAAGGRLQRDAATLQRGPEHRTTIAPAALGEPDLVERVASSEASSPLTFRAPT